MSFLASSLMLKISKRPKRPLQPVLLHSGQPLPLRAVAAAACSGVKPKPAISCSVRVCGAAHFLQTLRTRRWAIRQRADDATKKGFTPMSMRRATAEGASLVCSVEKTK